METIPTFTTTTWYRYLIQLGGGGYLLEFVHMQRQDAWYMTIMLPDKTVIMAGIRMVEKAPLMLRSSDPRLPLGMMVVLHVDGKSGDPVRDNFKAGYVELFYDRNLKIVPGKNSVDYVSALVKVS